MTISADKNKTTSENLLLTDEVFDRQWVLDNEKKFSKKSGKLVLEMKSTKRIDSAGICFIHLMHREFGTAGGKLILRNLSQELLSALQTWNIEEIPIDHNLQHEKNPFVRFGNYLVEFKEMLEKALSILTEMIYWGTLGLTKKRDFRKGVIGEQMYQLGYKAFGIVGLLSLLIGFVLALQTAIQLEMYGAGVWLAPLMAVTMVREMGPLLTAIILAGRTGSATTAEIATMVVNEEIDALKTMGINPIQFVVVPKFWAISITMPLLSILATGAGIIGGYLVAVFYLDLSSAMYWSGLSSSIPLRDMMAGFIKSIVFSWLIVWIGAHYGFKVRGGAEAVGKETTSSVVTGIFVIILADALFSFVL
jgi:phospholipid/cholesterol/gamma-HCH transport system permease protein